MTTVYDLPTDMLIKGVSTKLKQNEYIKPPAWSLYVKTGKHREMPPESGDWWYVRCASLLRRIYINGPVGIERLRSVYGGKERRGSQPAKFSKGSGSISREALQQLEKAGFVKTTKQGRVISPSGRKFLDGTAHELRTELSKQIPALEKF